SGVTPCYSGVENSVENRCGGPHENCSLPARHSSPQRTREATAMAESEERVVRLQVAGTKPEDAGKGVARLGRRAFETLGIQEGEIIAIQGKRLTAAIGLNPYPEDVGVEVIRLDGLQRANADVTMGDMVEVRKADVRPARRITIAPGQKNVRLSGSPELLRRTLFRRPLVAGDHISTAVYQRTLSPSAAGRYPEDIFKTF